MDINLPAPDSGQLSGGRYSKLVCSVRSNAFYQSLLILNSQLGSFSRDVGLTIVLNLENAFGNSGVIKLNSTEHIFI